VSSFNARTGGVVPTSGDYGFSQITGTAAVTQGGTGLTGITSGKMLYASGTNTLASLIVGDGLNIENDSLVTTSLSIPSFSGDSGLVLSNDGTSLLWSAVGSGTVTNVNVSGGTTGLTTINGPITTYGTITLGGTLGIANGGTNANTAYQALLNLLPSTIGHVGEVLAISPVDSSVIWDTTGGLGTVTSVGLSTGSTGLSVSGTNPIIGAGLFTLAGTLNVAHGGTGATTANAALNALLPSQSGHSGDVLTTGGTNATWVAPASITVTGGTGLGVSGSPVSLGDTVTLSNTGVTSIIGGPGIISLHSTGADTISAYVDTLYAGAGITIHQPDTILNTGVLSLIGGSNISVSGATGNVTVSSTALANPMTTLGDIIYEDTTPAAARLAGNTNAYFEVLGQTGTGSASAAPAWSIELTDRGLSNAIFVGEGGNPVMTGNDITAVGTNVLEHSTSGSLNTGVGSNALVQNTSGSENTGIGYFAVNYNTSGSYNTGIGDGALESDTTGSDNTAIGATADVLTGALTNATAIGYGAIVPASNTVQLGNTSVTNVNTSGVMQTGVVSSATGGVAFANASSSHLTTIKAGNATSAVTYTLPVAAPGTAGYLLASTTTGGLSWVAGGSNLPHLDNGMVVEVQAGTTSLTYKMQGFGLWITPSALGTGKELIIMSGTMSSTLTGDGAKCIIAIDTGFPPSNGDPPSGTEYGNFAEMNLAGGNGQQVPFSCSALAILTPGTTYWVDLKLEAITGGTATLPNVSVSWTELP
jgi:hypothetical protein